MNTLKPTGLQCEYVENPIGVGRQPCFGWKCACGRRGGRQTAYQLVMADTPEQLQDGIYTVWNTGKVISGDFAGVEYAGAALQSARRVYWQVRIWDEHDEASAFSEPAFFETGLLEPCDWKGRWMGFLGGMIGNGLQMRHSFTLADKPVEKARAYIAGLGYYELRLNGEKVGDKLLDPGATDASRTVLYSAYDITGNLRPGLNAVGIVLGTGWYGTPKALLQMNITFTDGSKQQVVTDWGGGGGWCVAAGPITYNSIYDGEDYDARLEKDGWDTPEYEDTFLREHQRPGGWILATVVEPPGGELVGEIAPPIRVTDTAAPKLLHTLPDGRAVYDIGINWSGWVRLQVAGARGARVSLTFAEVLLPDGDLDMRPLRLARCRDNYILRGDKGAEEYAPRFTYHGFRYFTVEIEGEAQVQAMTAEFVRSDLPRNATFTCDDDFLNRIAEAMWHTDACNLHSIPTDCCQRDERHGWTTDTTSRQECCTYHFDMAAFFEKWVRDIMDTQDGSGYFADTAPHRWGRRPSDPQVNTPVSLQLLLYRAYGNRRVLAENYGRLKQFVEALLVEAEDFLISRTGFGEWACPLDECHPEPFGAQAVTKHVTPTLVSTAYLYRSVCETGEIAAILGKEREAQYYANIARVVKERFNARFYHPETGQYDTGSQSSNALALALGLVEPENRRRVAENIAAKVVEKGYHPTTGNMGTKALIECLCEAGYDDLMVRLMSEKTAPSFGFMLEQGATTMWERWNADRDNNIMNSRNHPMLSACGVWFYKYLAGIRRAEQTSASRELVIAPCVPAAIGFVRAGLELPAGRVLSEWEQKDGRFTLRVTIPFGATATVIIPRKAAAPGAVLREGGLPVGQAEIPGLTPAGGDEATYTVEITAGSYEFTLEA